MYAHVSKRKADAATTSADRWSRRIVRVVRRTAGSARTIIREEFPTGSAPATIWDSMPVRPHLVDPEIFTDQCGLINKRHSEQTIETVTALREKYSKPVFGRIKVWDLIEKLGQCVDPTDPRLYCVSQLMHVLQMLEEMENDGVANEELILAALVHDLGKVLLLTDEAPENIVCLNKPIGVYEPGVGLDKCIFQWNHDEFAYSRLKDYLPDGLAWLVRYHSIVPASCEQYMDARDRAYAELYLRVFAHYDQCTKSPYFLTKKRIKDYFSIINSAFPEPIVF